ncbi:MULTISPECIES: Lrp/AsnC family transcriptional regulator [unclassified Leeuwenhoekiella]|uniref:Lrp/AsnC family transcriptional regulator n=1 Tax=unclassified Leeuwenhoekiella TaxID=2615029 RepID=UPI000C581410|nr:MULTISPECIES: Lrp/AsnC family transcriptional regulator [unclassified Leeuwenhoekiella]MAW94996.1 AsnC family transcriptional regulator [Leeuwenhoekiella sp.]MBA79716.1 AsnC family transcriptional regulator [Leeuwenhoekiella sp.]|tara:strand:- start:1659 stop:2120 length:462 start_codon:yes stop_codon:yes gene_type:complete
MKLDDTDKKLLAILQEDSKTPIKDIASRLNLTKTPIYERIKRYEQEGLIKKYVGVLDPSKLDTVMVVFCSVSLESQKLDALESFDKAIADIPEVVECYLMGGANDFLLKVVVKDLQAYHTFSSGKLAALPNVSQIKSTFVLNEVKRATVIPLF